MRIETRHDVPLWLTALAPLVAIAVTLLLNAGFVLWANQSPIHAYAELIKGAFGSRFAWSETLVRTTPLIFNGLAAAVAFRARLWNIGGEGQLYAGALAVTGLGTGMVTLPVWLMIPFLFVVAGVAGGLLLLIPTWLKTHLNVDEVVTTLLFNFVVILWVNYLLFGPWKDPMAMGWPQGAPVIDPGVLPPLIACTRLHAGFLFAVQAAVLVWGMIRFTTWGFEIRAIGHNLEAARFAGLPINAAILRTALLSGGLAACAGVTEVAGTKGYLTLDISPGFGYTGIAVAMLAGLHPLGVILAAIFFAGIYNGADSMSRAIGVSNYLADVITATALLLVLLAVALTRLRIRWT